MSMSDEKREPLDDFFVRWGEKNAPRVETPDGPGTLFFHREFFSEYARMQHIDKTPLDRTFVHRDCVAHATPKTPRCVGCGKAPSDLAEYVNAARKQDPPLSPLDYVLRNEGTLNETNGHYRCTECYIRSGQPPGKAP